jgi:hypothetical protein
MPGSNGLLDHPNLLGLDPTFQIIFGVKDQARANASVQYFTGLAFRSIEGRKMRQKTKAILGKDTENSDPKRLAAIICVARAAA